MLYHFTIIWLHRFNIMFSFYINQTLIGGLPISVSFLNVQNSKVHGANMGPTWVLSAPDGPHAGPMNLGIRGSMFACFHKEDMARKRCVASRKIVCIFDNQIKIFQNGYKIWMVPIFICVQICDSYLIMAGTESVIFKTSVIQASICVIHCMLPANVLDKFDSSANWHNSNTLKT